MFDNAKQLGNSQVTALVGGICKLAGCLEGRANASQREQILHETLKLAYQIEDAMNKKEERIAYLDHLAMTDGLCGILNRRGFQIELQRVLSSARRFDETGMLAYIDLDDFKKINDRHGHACGDEVLKRVARILETEIRSMDYVARLGGDEFAVLLVRTSQHHAEQRIQKIAQEINQCRVSFDNYHIVIKASVGMHAYDQNTLSHELLNHADNSMYEVKKTKNGIEQNQCGIKAAE